MYVEVKSGDLFQILSSSTIIGNARRVPSYIGEKAIDIKLDSLLVHESDSINIRQLTPYKLAEFYLGEIPIILGLGSSAECGKTTLKSLFIGKGISRN